MTRKNHSAPTQRTGLVVSGILLALVCAWMVSNRADWIECLLIDPLEHRFERADVSAPDRLTGLIVLTGADERLAEAGRLARLYPQLKVVISGAKGIRALPAELGGGIEPGRVVLETRAQNTYENAVNSADLIRPKPNQRWLLVTGSLHMARAIGAFRKIGFEVEPWPVEEMDRRSPAALRAALHEWVALISYRMLGQTNAFFPGPPNRRKIAEG
jgi:uncharacterized SAM-binding protein YcdF (DUF218 family)